MRSIRMGVTFGAFAAVLAGCADDGADVATESEGTTAATEQMCDADNGGLTLADGFCAQVVHEGVGEGRHLAVADNGDIYVALRQAQGGPNDQGIVALRDTDGDGRADQEERFGEYRGTGIAIHNGYLYFATDTSVVRYPMPTGSELVPTGPAEMVVSGFPVQRAHAAKTMAFDGSRMWVNVGAPSNNCGGETDRQPGATGQQPCPELEDHGGVWLFSDEPGQTFADGERYISGTRNAMAIGYNPMDSELWGVQHGRDQLDVVDREDFTAEGNATRPAEELLRMTEGTTFSWPYCFWDNETGLRLQAPEYGGDGTADSVGDCDQYPEPVAAFGGHWAPIDILFYQGDSYPERYRNGAFIAFHGSWNRAPLPQAGYQVVFQPLSGATSDGEYEVFANGFAGMESIPSPDQAAHRPVGLATGPDGSVYISDSVEGRIWRVRYTGG